MFRRPALLLLMLTLEKLPLYLEANAVFASRGFAGTKHLQLLIDKER
jgi:hypothetical protein